MHIGFDFVVRNLPPVAYWLRFRLKIYSFTHLCSNAREDFCLKGQFHGGQSAGSLKSMLEKSMNSKYRPLDLHLSILQSSAQQFTLLLINVTLKLFSSNSISPRFHSIVSSEQTPKPQDLNER